MEFVGCELKARIEQVAISDSCVHEGIVGHKPRCRRPRGRRRRLQEPVASPGKSGLEVGQPAAFEPLEAQPARSFRWGGVAANGAGNTPLFATSKCAPVWAKTVVARAMATIAVDASFCKFSICSGWPLFAGCFTYGFPSRLTSLFCGLWNRIPGVATTTRDW